MDYQKTENEIIEATKEFATINNIHYDELTESMITNAVRELNKCFISHVSYPVAQQYAEFCVRCDREKLPLINIEDYLKQL